MVMRIAVCIFSCFYWGVAIADVSLLGIELGATNLTKIQSTLGSADIIKSGDASTSESSICYRAKSGEYLVFVSYTEMAGVNLDLTAIRISIALPSARSCPLIEVSSPIKFSNGLQLGSSPSFYNELKRGKESPDGSWVNCQKENFKKGTREYDLWLNREGCFSENEEPYYSVCNSMHAQFVNEKIVWIEVSRIESVC